MIKASHGKGILAKLVKERRYDEKWARVMAESLTDLRQKIDFIDQQLLALLADRQQLSRAVVRQKTAGSNIFRPDREVSLLRNLMDQRGEVSPKLIIGIWRQIISASIAEQKPDYMIAHSANAASLAQMHGAGYMQLRQSEDATGAIDALAQSACDCVIITQDELPTVIPYLGESDDQGLFVVASIGFLDDAQPRGYILCRELPDLSGDDVIMVKDQTGAVTYHGADDVVPTGTIVGIYARPISFAGITKSSLSQQR